MDRGPFRVQRPADGKGAGRPEPTQRQADDEQVNESGATPQRSSRTVHYDQPSPKKKRSGTVLTVLAVLFVLGAGSWFGWTAMKNAQTGIDSSKYQVVSLSDGQVYFGKLAPMNDGYMKLTNVYYLQPIASEATDDASDSEDLKDTEANQNNFKLVKFTDIVYGPEDAMVISKEQILHYDNLSPEGKVAKGIEQYKASN